MSTISHKGIVEADNATADRCPSVTGPLSEVLNSEPAAPAAEPELPPIPSDPVPGTGSRQLQRLPPPD